MVPTWSKKSNPTEGSQGPPWSGFLWSLWSHLSLPSRSRPPPQPFWSFCCFITTDSPVFRAFELVTLLPGMIFMFLLFKSAQISVSQVGFPGGSLGTRDWSYCCSIAKSCLTLCDPMGCSTPGYPVLHYLLELVQIHVYGVGDHQTISFSVISFSFCLQSFPTSGSYLMNRLFASGGQSIGASASVLPMNIQDGFPLGLVNLISLQSKGL